jgi:hypothetical protein
LHVRDAVLYRPPTVAGRVNPLPHGEGEILVPRHVPVGGGSLVEQQAPRQGGVRPQNRLHQGANGGRGRQLRDRGHAARHVTQPAAAARSPFRIRAFDSRQQVLDPRCGEHAPNERDAVRVEGTIQPGRLIQAQFRTSSNGGPFGTRPPNTASERT